jgi:hypothetical protein
MKAEVHTQPDLARDLSRAQEIVLARVKGVTHLWISDGSQATTDAIATYLGNIGAVTVTRFKRSTESLVVRAT